MVSVGADVTVATTTEDELKDQPPTHPSRTFKPIYRGICLHNRYEIRQLLGQGSFAEIWEAMDFVEKAPVAIKLLLQEKEAKKPLSEMVDELKIEANLHHAISSKVKKVPRFYDSHKDEKYGPYIVMGMLGADLGQIMRVLRVCKNERKLTISMVGRIGCAAMECLRDLHGQGFIHRDLKPQNLLLGQLGTNEQLDVYIIDFGFAKKHMDPRTRKVIPPENRPHFKGTAPYSSLRSMRFEDQGRRDDIEGLCFLLIELLLGGLPWSKLILQPGDRRERDKQICDMKETFIKKASELCKLHVNSFQKQLDNAYCGPYDGSICDVAPENATRFLPPEIIKCLVHAHHLEYAQQPDYDMMRNLLANMEDQHVQECNRHFKTNYNEDSYRTEVLQPLVRKLYPSQCIRDCMDFYINGVCFERGCKLQHLRSAAPDEVLNTYRGKRNREHDDLGDNVAGPPPLVHRKPKRTRQNVLVAM